MFSEQTVVWGFDEVVVAIIELLFYRNYDSTLRKMNYFYSFSDLPLVTHPHSTEGAICPRRLSPLVVCRVRGAEAR